MALQTKDYSDLQAVQATALQPNIDFGKVIVCGNYEGDLKAIVDNLNSLCWAGAEGWGVKQSPVPKGGAKRQIIVPKGDYWYTLRPTGEIFVLSDGRRCFASDADESFIEEWEAARGDSEVGPEGVYSRDECTLGELSAFISPHLNKGTIEFALVKAESRSGYVSHERLLVRSDGSAEYHKCTSDYYFNRVSHPDSEYYEPESSKGARSRKH